MKPVNVIMTNKLQFSNTYSRSTFNVNVTRTCMSLVVVTLVGYGFPFPPYWSFGFHDWNTYNKPFLGDVPPYSTSFP